MISSPSIALDLPLKMLVAEDPNGKVWISYNDAEYLRARHNLSQELLQNLAVADLLAAKAAE